MRDTFSTTVEAAAYLARMDADPAERPDPSEYMDEPCDAIDGEDEPYDDCDAPEWAMSESEQDWRAELRADATA
jgi:hypothetical protein